MGKVTITLVGNYRGVCLADPNTLLLGIIDDSPITEPEDLLATNLDGSELYVESTRHLSMLTKGSPPKESEFLVLSIY